MSEGIRFQSSLGKVQEDHRRDLDMGGILILGEVTKVYPKYHTADVKLVNRTYGALVGSSSTYGKLSCKIMESFAGYDSKLGVAFGKATPIQKGCTVIIGFINNKKAQPVILGCVHNPEILKNNLLDYPENNTEAAEEYQSYQLFMTKLQDYFYANKEGEIELGHHTKSFIKFSAEELDDTRDTGFSNTDLFIRNKRTGAALWHNNESTFKPFSILAVLRDKFENATSSFLRLLITGRKIRLSKDNPDNLVFLELEEDGTFRIKQQFDSPQRDSSKNYTEFKLDMETQKVKVSQHINDSVTTIEVAPNSGVLVKSSKEVSVSSTKNVNITSSEVVNITAKDIALNVGGE